MMKTILDFFRIILASKIGYLLLILHLAIVIYAFSQLDSNSDAPCHGASFAPGWTTIAGRYFHSTYEPLITIIMFFDLPSVLVGGIIACLFLPLNFCDYTMSWISAISILIFASFQWQLIGCWLESFVTTLKNRSKINRN